MIRLLTGLLASSFLIACASAPAPDAPAAPAMVIVSEEDVKVDEPPPHGKIGMSTAWRISDAVPVRAFEFRKRALHPGSAIGLHPINHDEIYYVLSGEGIVHSDGEEQTLTEGMAAYLYTGANVGIRQVGAEPLVLIIAYPPGK
nr:cupin domain-containing protein [Hyphomonas sp.]